MSLSKAKLFVENFVVYGLGGIVNKIIPLIMVPIVTRIMPNAMYFGISDLSSTIVSFASALAIMGMYDAMYRMFFEKDEEEYKKSVCSTALFFTLGMSLIIFLLMIFTRERIAEWFFKDAGLVYLVDIAATATLVSAANAIIAAPSRMQNKRKIFLAANTFGPLISYSLAIPLLLRGYYITALPLAGLFSAISVTFAFSFLNRKWFNFREFDKKLLTQLLAIGVPLLPNFLIYWVFNSSDKLMINGFIGAGAVGVYSVGSKLGHASQLIYMAFAGGWQYFAFSTMREKNQVRSNTLVFEYLGVLSFIATTFICAWSRWIYEVLFIGEYVKGYIISPYLFLAPLLLMLFQIASNQFLVVKKTWPLMFLLLSGAVLNVALNLVLIPRIGIEGAAIATLLGYLASNVITVLVLQKMRLMELDGRFVFLSVALLSYFIVWRFFAADNLLIGNALAFVFTAISLLTYRKDFSGLLGRHVKRGV